MYAILTIAETGAIKFKEKQEKYNRFTITQKLKKMENFYTAYTKVIDNKTYYFVKKFLAFPEFKDVSPVQESYGMHLDFNKACNIAGLYDAKIKEQLLMDMEENVQHAKIIDLNILNYSGKTASN